MAANEDKVKKKRKTAAPEGASVPAAKQQIRRPRRSGAGEEAGGEAKKQGTTKAPQEKMCSVCPDRPATEHLKPWEQKEDTVYWCADCWKKYYKQPRSEEASASAPSNWANTVKVVRSPEDFDKESRRMLYHSRLEHHGTVFSQVDWGLLGWCKGRDGVETKVADDPAAGTVLADAMTKEEGGQVLQTP